jgi:hypothetical protein
MKKPKPVRNLGKMPPNPPRTAGDQKAWMEANLTLLSEAARDAYARRGRGAFVYDEAQLAARAADPMNLPGLYVPDAEAYTRIGGWPSVHEARWVSEYNPKTHMVLIFVRADRGVSSYRVELAPEPPGPGGANAAQERGKEKG